MKLYFKSYYLLALLGPIILFFSACKSTQVIAEGTTNTKLSAKGVVKNHYVNSLDFKTLRGRMKIDYADKVDSQSFSVSLRMEKDKAIWISAPLGLVKAYITPERVSFYNKLQNEYFDGDFSYLSKLLGTEVDFDKVQNLLVGQAIFDLQQERYVLGIHQNNYELKPKKAGVLFKTLFQIEPKNFKIALQQISQPEKDRILNITYVNYQEIGGKVFPNKILIAAKAKDDTNTIDVSYRGIEFNKPLSFPYKIPKGFTEIVL